MRNTSVAFRAAAYRPSTDQVLTMLLTIEHPNLTEPIRLSTDNKDSFTFEGETVRGTISNGQQYLYMPMQVTWPDDTDETITQARIQIDNVNKDILMAVREMDEAPQVTMQVVLASSPNTVEAEANNLELQDVDGDALAVSAVLTRRHFFGEPYPGISMLPGNCPGMF
jgi:hypothetical protein